MKNKVLSLRKNISYNLIEDLPLQNVKYDFSINTPFLNREWSKKLRQYCISQKLNINDFLKIICSSIIQKTDSNINIYNALNSNDKIQNNITYSRYSGCQIMNESPNLYSYIYANVFVGARKNKEVALSEKLTLRKNAIYINSKVSMPPVSAIPNYTGTFFSGSMRNMIGSVEFIDGEYYEINYNIFGIKVSNMYLIMSFRTMGDA